ncbi:unnamed protein product [Urochloa humidicola]
MAGKPKTIEELWDAWNTQAKIQEGKAATMMKSITELNGRMDCFEKGKSTAFDSQAQEERERRKKAAEVCKQALEAAAAAAAKVMEVAGHGDSSSSIDDIISQLGKLSTDSLPKPPTAIKDSSTTIKLPIPCNDSKEDPLPWLNKCEQFFVSHSTPENKKVCFASYHLEGAAQQWYMRLDKEHRIEDWDVFVRAVNTRFGPPFRRNPLGELTALKKTGSVEAHSEQFLSIVTRVHHLDEIQLV